MLDLELPPLHYFQFRQSWIPLGLALFALGIVE